MRELTAAQTASGGNAAREPAARIAEEEHVSSPTQAEGPARQTTAMSPSCCQTPLAPGFVLWTPSSPADASHREISLPSSPAASSASSSSSVLVVMFTWLFCTPRSAARYVELYTCRGWHVLHVSSRLLHFLWPPRSRSFALDLARVLRERCGQYTHVIVHAMSIGAYNYTTCQMSAGEEPDLRTYLFDKLRAAVFDSLTMGSLEHMVRGIAMGLSEWRAVQTAARSVAGLYFLLTRETTVRAFDEGVAFFRTSPALVPTLVFGSEDDPMCEVEALSSLLRGWGGGGMEAAAAALPALSSRVWERSGHCAHLFRHAHEYRQLLHRFLLSLDFVSRSSPEGGGGDGGQGEAGHLVSKL